MVSTLYPLSHLPILAVSKLASEEEKEREGTAVDKIDRWRTPGNLILIFDSYRVPKSLGIPYHIKRHIFR